MCTYIYNSMKKNTVKPKAHIGDYVQVVSHWQMYVIFFLSCKALGRLGYSQSHLQGTLEGALRSLPHPSFGAL